MQVYMTIDYVKQIHNRGEIDKVWSLIEYDTYEEALEAVKQLEKIDHINEELHWHAKVIKREIIKIDTMQTIEYKK